MMKAEALEKSKCNTKTDEATDIVSDLSDVSVATSKTGDELIHGEENGASTTEVCASLLDVGQVKKLAAKIPCRIGLCNSDENNYIYVSKQYG